MRHIGLTAIGMILAAAGAASAAETAMATVAQTGTSGTNNVFTVTLVDTGSTTIGSFWYGWIPGHDFLTSTPVSTVNPTGWTDNIIANDPGSDGASIQWLASSASSYLQPNGSAMFQFTSPDSLASITGLSPYGSGHYDSGESFVYSHGLFSDAGDELTVTAPEPAAAALIGSASLLAMKRRRRKI